MGGFTEDIAGTGGTPDRMSPLGPWNKKCRGPGESYMSQQPPCGSPALAQLPAPGKIRTPGGSRGLCSGEVRSPGAGRGLYFGPPGAQAGPRVSPAPGGSLALAQLPAPGEIRTPGAGRGLYFGPRAGPGGLRAPAGGLEGNKTRAPPAPGGSPALAQLPAPGKI